MNNNYVDGDLISRKAVLDALKGNVLIDVTPEIERTIEEQPCAYNPEKVLDELDDYLFEKYCIEGVDDVPEIIMKGGVS